MDAMGLKGQILWFPGRHPGIFWFQCVSWFQCSFWGVYPMDPGTYLLRRYF